MQPAKISSLKVSFGQNVTRYQYMLKQLSVELQTRIWSTLNFNQRQMKSPVDTFSGSSWQTALTAHPLPIWIIIWSVLVGGMAPPLREGPGWRPLGQAETSQPAHTGYFLSPLLVPASLYCPTFSAEVSQNTHSFPACVGATSVIAYLVS